jgi:hypothetical protein
MKNHYNIEQKIDETLESTKGISSAEPKPFFYTRLHARMERELLQPKTVLGFQLKPIYAYSVIMALLIMNIFAISNFKNHQNNPSQEDSYSLYQAE